MAFQPAPEQDGLYYPSALAAVGDGIYLPGDLVEDPAGSSLYAFEIGDYAYPVLTPIPHVELTLFTLDSNTVTATVYRTVGTRTMPVRGQIGVYAAGGINVVDWEAPFGVPVSYRAEQFDADGNSLGYSPAFSTQLDVAETWIQNPFDPLGAIQVTFTNDAAATRPRPTDVNTVWANGSGLATTIASQRRGLVDAPASFYTRTQTDADAVNAMLGDPYTVPTSPPVLVIRTGTNQRRMRFPQPLIAVVDYVETDVDAQAGGDIIRWDGTVTEIQQPAPALVPALLTLADIDASYTTLGDIDTAYDVLGSIDRDYSLAGTAGDQP